MCPALQGVTHLILPISFSGGVSINPIGQMKSGGTERLSNLPKIAQLLSDKTEVQIQAIWLFSPYLSY